MKYRKKLVIEEELAECKEALKRAHEVFAAESDKLKFSKATSNLLINESKETLEKFSKPKEVEGAIEIAKKMIKQYDERGGGTHQKSALQTLVNHYKPLDRAKVRKALEQFGFDLTGGRFPKKHLDQALNEICGGEQ